MDDKGPRITWEEQPRTVEEELEEELFFLDLFVDKVKEVTPEISAAMKRKKEIEEKLKLLKIEKDF